MAALPAKVALVSRRLLATAAAGPHAASRLLLPASSCSASVGSRARVHPVSSGGAVRHVVGAASAEVSARTTTYIIGDEVDDMQIRGKKRPRIRPWERTSLCGAEALMDEMEEEEWLEAEIARFVPMQPWPLSMQEVLDMLEPQKIAKYLHSEVPVRVAERIRWIEDIPDFSDIPQLAEVHRWHKDTFKSLRLVKRKGKGGLDAFTKVVEEAVASSVDLPAKLAFGMRRLYREHGDAYDSTFVDPWMDNFLLNHIGTNFIMAQYLAAARKDSNQDGLAGLVDPCCNVADLCRDAASDVMELCAQQLKKRPEVKVEAYSASGDDHGLPRFAFIPSYLKTILLEVLKNSCRATANKAQSDADLDGRPIQMIVCADKHSVIIRINDCAGGIPFEVGEHVWSYFYSTSEAKDETQYGDSQNDLAGYGVGLPFSRLFAKYLGGSIRLTSLPGYGTSVDIHISRVTTELVEQVPDDDNIPVTRRSGSSIDHLKI